MHFLGKVHFFPYVPFSNSASSDSVAGAMVAHCLGYTAVLSLHLRCHLFSCLAFLVATKAKMKMFCAIIDKKKELG